MTLISAPFGARTTADEVVEGLDLSALRAVVTGGASGIGIETARSLARAGAAVTLAVRDTAAGGSAAADIASTTSNDRVEVAYVDLVDLDSVQAFTDAWEGPLDLLVNNAGVMAVPTLELTARGWERQLAANHLGHFALTVGLHDALAAADAPRVVSVSSSGHLASPVVFDDLHFERRDYDPWSAYGQSKTANVLLAVEITRRWAEDGIVANALMPGGIMTNLQRYVSDQVKDRWQQMQDSGEVRFKTPQEGAATSLVAAVSPQLAGRGGHYLEDCVEAETVADDAWVQQGVRAYALDPEAATRLWDVSAELVGRG